MPYSRFGWYRGRTMSTSSSRSDSPALSRAVKQPISGRELHPPLPSLCALFKRAVAPPSTPPPQQWQPQYRGTDSAVASAQTSPAKDSTASTSTSSSSSTIKGSATVPTMPTIIPTPPTRTGALSYGAFPARQQQRRRQRPWRMRATSPGSDSDIDVDDWVDLMQDSTAGEGASSAALLFSEAENQATRQTAASEQPSAAHQPASPIHASSSISAAETGADVVTVSTLLYLPRELIQQQILPLLSLEDMSALRQTCRYMRVVVDDVKEYRVLWRVADTYRQQKRQGRQCRGNPVISLVHDTICVQPPPSVPPARLAAAAVRYHADWFPQARPNITTAEAAVDLASVAALVGAHRFVYALLTHHTIASELPRRKAAAMLLALRVAVKMGHLECIQAVFEAMASLAPPSPIISRQSLLAFFDQCLHNGHASAARLIAEKADYTPEQQIDDALYSAGNMTLSRPFAVNYFLSLAVPSEDQARFASVVMERACQQGDTAMLYLVLTKHSAHASARLSHVEMCIRWDTANVLCVLHDALGFDRSTYLELLPGLSHPWPLLAQMCQQGAVRCLDLLRTRCGFGPHIMAHVSAHLVRLCQPGNDARLQKLLRFLHRTNLSAGISRERFEALAVACCRHGLHVSLSCLLNNFLLNNIATTTAASNSARSAGGHPRRHSNNHHDGVCCKRGDQLQAVRQLFLASDRLSGQQCPLVHAVVFGHPCVVAALHEHGIFSADDEPQLHLLPSLVGAIAGNMHTSQPGPVPVYPNPQQQQHQQQSVMQQDRTADKSCCYFDLLRMLWQELSDVYVASATDLSDVIRVACEHELVDVLCSVLLNLTDTDVAQQVLERVRQWPRQLVSNHVGQLAVRHLARAAI